MQDRSTHKFVVVACAAARLVCAAAARADDDRYRSTVRGDASETVVTRIDATQPSARLVSVADLVAGSAGVFVRERGGLGSFTSVSIRGSEANDVAVLVDGMPLSRASAGVIDLSQLPVAGLERVEVYRGVPPLEFGPEAVAGAINLVTRRGALVPVLRASVGGGSFGARSAGAGWSGTDHGLRVDVAASYAGAGGDFPYYDTAGTLVNTSDDRLSVRRNNDFDQGTIDVGIGGGDALHWRLGTHGFLKRQGVPGVGLAGAETVRARLTTGRALVDGELDGAAGPFAWRAAAQLSYERSAFSNPAGELVGPFGPNVSDADALSAGLHGRAAARWGRRQRWILVADARTEQRWPHDLLYPEQSGQASYRLLGGVGVEDALAFFGERLTVTAGLRLDGAHNQLSLPAAGALRPSTDLEPTGRVTVRAAPTRWLTLRAAAGRFVRFPTLLELFGDGAFILPRTLLVPETAWAGDVGATVAGAGRIGRGSLEATFFGRATRDTIVYLPGARATAPANIGPARMLGLELRAQASLGRFLAARLDYTFLDARDDQGGGQIPGRPRHELTARVDAHLRPFTVWYELSYLGRVYRDPANAAFVPARALHAVGASFDRGWLRFDVELRNVADLRVTPIPAAGRQVPYPLVDYFDYPLPGRAFYATLVLRK